MQNQVPGKTDRPRTLCTDSSAVYILSEDFLGPQHKYMGSDLEVGTYLQLIKVSMVRHTVRLSHKIGTVEMQSHAH